MWKCVLRECWQRTGEARLGLSLMVILTGLIILIRWSWPQFEALIGHNVARYMVVLLFFSCLLVIAIIIAVICDAVKGICMVVRDCKREGGN